MTRDQFDALVAKLETSAARHPKLYIARVIALVMLAYGYLAFVFAATLLVVALLIGLIVLKPNAATIKIGIVFGLVAGGLAWAILKGLWVRLEPPTGVKLTRDSCPELFAMLDELRRQLGSKRFHEVLLVGDFNAAVVQVPRLGVFGWHKNFLLLGLPLMQTLGPDEFKAVLAHEFAHLSGGHGRFGNWLYRMRRSWDRIFEQMVRQQSGGAWVLTTFVKWYWPKFNAHAFVLARANEYEADACSARLAGASNAASALTRIEVYAQQLENKFWPVLYKRANEQEQPPTDVFRSLGHMLSIPPAEMDTTRWLRHAFLRPTNNVDTHPALSDRLRALGELPAGAERGQLPKTLPPPPARTASAMFLGSGEVGMTTRLSEEWRDNVTPVWAARHHEVKQVVEQLKSLAAEDGPNPPVETLWKRASILIDLEGDSAAGDLLDRILTQEPNHAGANFIRGRYLLEQDDARGVVCLERAITEDPTLTADGCGLIHGHYVRTGQRDRLRAVEDRIEQHQEVEQRARDERANITAKDTFLPHKLTPEQIDALRAVLSGEPEVGAVHVACKQVTCFPKEKCRVISVKVSASWWSFRSEASNQKLVERLIQQIALPGYFLVFVPEQNLKALGKKVAAVEGSLIYESSRR